MSEQDEKYSQEINGEPKNKQVKQKVKKNTLDILSDDDNVANIRSSLVGIFIFFAPIIVLGFVAQVTLDMLFKLDIGLLGFIGIFSIRFGRREITKRAIAKSYKDVPALKENDSAINDELDNINVDVAIQEIEKENECGRKSFNKLKTNSKIAKLNAKLYNAKTKQKSNKITKLENIIKELKANPVGIRWFNIFTKKYKPISITKFLKRNGHNVQSEIMGDSKYSYKPESDGRYSSWIFTIIKTLGMTSMAATTFLLDIPFWAMVAYYAGLILSILSLLVKRYPRIYFLTTVKQLGIKKNKLKLLKKINATELDPKDDTKDDTKKEDN